MSWWLDWKTVRFLAVGVANAVVGAGIMFGLYNLAHCSYWFSSAASYIIASILSFFLNKYFTFRNKAWEWRQVVRFVLNIAICYFAAYGIAKPLVRWILSGSQLSVAFQENIAMMMGMCFFTGLNYLGQRFFAFAEKKNQETSSVHIEFHADDYAVSICASYAILTCLRNGVLNGISIMPNSPCLSDCMKKLEAEGQHSEICIHLNLVEGHCCAPVERVSLLVDNTGNFKLSFFKLLLASWSWHRRKYQRQLKEELVAQITAAIPFFHGRPIRLDSHVHYHAIPVVFDSLMQVIEEMQLNVEYLRQPNEPILPLLQHISILRKIRPVNLLKVLILKILCWRNYRKLPKTLKDAKKVLFFGLGFSGHMFFQEVSRLLPQFIQLAASKNADLEVLFHPGKVNSLDEAQTLTNRDDAAFLTSKNRELEAESLISLKTIYSGK